MIKIMSLIQNMWERPLIHEIVKVRAEINELEDELRETCPKNMLGVGNLTAGYQRMAALTGLLSKAHTNRIDLMKKLQQRRK